MARQISKREKKKSARKAESCCEIIEQRKEPITLDEFNKLMKWAYSDRGVVLSKAWVRINEEYFDGVLKPCPILLPSSPPYGHWIGLCSNNEFGETVHIQLKRDMTLENHIDVLLHECLHSYLFARGLSAKHNDIPWCEHIIKLTKRIWGIDIWASPSVPRRIKGISKRIQKTSPTGQISIVRSDIARWPHSLNLHLTQADDWANYLQQ